MNVKEEILQTPQSLKDNKRVFKQFMPVRLTT